MSRINFSFGPRAARVLLVLVTVAGFVGCRQQMFYQPKFKPLEKSEFFDNGQASRTLVAGTVPRGYLRANDHLYQGKIGDTYVTDFPFAVSKEIMARGKVKYDAYCSMCHGFTGYGNGMIVQRGFSAPPSFHDPKTRNKPVGYYFNVVTHGYGSMASYASAIPVNDRWAILSYVRALQHSQNVNVNDLGPEDRKKLEAANTPAKPGAEPHGGGAKE